MARAHKKQHMVKRASPQKKQKLKRNAPLFALSTVKVVGIGGGGGNAVSRMSRDFVRGVEFIAINTDHQDLDYCEAKRKIYIGKNLTKGLGTGMNPELGRQAAEENRSEIAESIQGASLVFLAAGLGGGTGTGGIPVVAEVARQAGALTIAFVTKPFSFEGSQREKIAQEGLNKLRDKVDALIVVPNDRIFSVISKETPVNKAFEAIDEVMKNALLGIVEMIATPGMINVDFADMRTILQDAGSAIVGLGIASGQDRASAAVQKAITSPLLEMSPEGAKGILLGISGRDLKMHEIHEAAKTVAQIADPSARIIFGAYHDRKLKPKQMKVILIATGLNGAGQSQSLFGGYSLEEKKESVLPIAESEWQATDRGNMWTHAEPTVSQPASLQHETKENPSPDSPQRKKSKSSQKNEVDVWEIPTFLRRKKKR
ncbi:cell division protein FtsZ [Candidatus Parcubacteria bacterium]|nr:MAG: cell division protein FtsZ [Candidatus Parcubacteria bacterium]